jgi:hypothetical protein
VFLTPARSTSNAPPKLLDQARAKLWVKHYSIRTEEVYADWIKRYVVFHRKRHASDMAAPEVEAFLTVSVKRKQ